MVGWRQRVRALRKVKNEKKEKGQAVGDLDTRALDWLCSKCAHLPTFAFI